MLKYMAVIVFVSSTCCFCMNGASNVSFMSAVREDPTGDLNKLTCSLAGEERELAGKFCQLYVNPSENRKEVLNSLNESDLTELYVAADLVARSYYAAMQADTFDAEKAKEAVRWLNLLNSDIRSKDIRESAYRDGEKISDLLQIAQLEVKRREEFDNADQKCEEELVKLLEGTEEED